ncbi:hypothetical protein WDJ51_07880 [Rathayibacter sp. YIM 133350]|uniref:hypothetical protein n=1 Tax=Rathayibacter sp. YIM 133350 TaxID=3131992 RepID=UPI00307F52AE
MLGSINDLLVQASVHLATTPPVTPDEDTVTPGIVGFIITFLIAAATVLLILDMVRRVRRTNYRAQVRERLTAEQLHDGGATTDAPAAAPPATEDPDAPTR